MLNPIILMAKGIYKLRILAAIISRMVSRAHCPIASTHHMAVLDFSDKCTTCNALISKK
jgi:hypothetical protein